MCNSKKKCNKCGEEKDLCEFGIDKYKKDGRNINCILCKRDNDREIQRRIRGSNPNKFLITKTEKEELDKKQKQRCGYCKVVKPFDDFSLDKNRNNGRSNTCKSCIIETQREMRRRQNNINPDNFYISKKEKLELDKQEKQRCGRCKVIKPFDDFRNDKRANNGKLNTCRSCVNKIQSERQKNNVLYRLRRMCSNAIKEGFRRKGYTKKTKTYQILGCSFEELKSHIESKFEPWMKWENQGLYNGTENYGWDLDHIIPISSAATEEEIIKLNHYTNFQPLCSYINRVVKRDRLDYYQ